MDSRLGQGRRGGRLGWRAWVVLGAAWFATLEVRPLLDPDEGRYAEIPREMLASGDWITPRFDGLKYFEKPPLQYWATAAAYRAFGLEQWSSRLWSVGLAFACLPLVFTWVARLYGRDGALLALTALAVSPFFVIVGHLNLLDGGFTFWLTAAVLAFTLAQGAPPASAAERGWMLAAWGAGALAVLSKGIVVGVLAGAALILYSLSERDTHTWRRLHPGAGLALFTAVAAPWFVVVSLRNPSFPGFFFVHEHFTRFLTTVHQRVEPWWYFLPLLLLGVLPWTAPLVQVIAAGRLVYSARRNSYVPHQALWWALAGALAALPAVAVSFMSRASTERPAPLVTAASAILAWQCLLCAYTVIPPARSARDLVSAARSFIGARTPLYSVGQYRETLSPYLGRTLQPVSFEGELRFGLQEQPERRMALAQFAARWSAGGDAVAFFDPGVWDECRRQGLPGRVIAADDYTVAVSRL